MSHSKVILFTVDIVTRGLAALTLLKSFSYIFQQIVFGAWDSFIWFYPIFWLVLLSLCVYPNLIVNKIDCSQIASWFIARIPAFSISIIGVWFFFNSGG